MYQRIFLVLSLILLSISCRSSDGSDYLSVAPTIANDSQVELGESVVRQPTVEALEIPSEVYAGDSFKVVVSSDGGLLGSIKIFGKSTPLLLVDTNLLSSVVAVPIEQPSGPVVMELSVTGIKWRVEKIISMDLSLIHI